MHAYEAWHTITLALALALAESGGTTVEVAVTRSRCDMTCAREQPLAVTNQA